MFHRRLGVLLLKGRADRMMDVGQPFAKSKPLPLSWSRLQGGGFCFARKV
ncbi:Hypothetical Protein OBI_RACECAR_282 [Arthrobacter phage Racecar]|nr:hypothetical protein PBI_RACECAR_74 [Arthrobacter phage Racecar]